MQKLSPRRQFFLCKSGKTFYPNLKRFVWRRHAGDHPDGHQHGGRKPTETSVTEAWFKRHILHAPNRIAKLNACKMQRLNQLNATCFNSMRVSRIFD